MFISAEASISNALPIVFALLAITLGFIIGDVYNPWMDDVIGIDILLGTMSMILIFFPFNILSALIALLFYIYIKRRDPWIYQPKTT